MSEFCTCGTTLVEKARFCHMCGRPTAESPAVLSGVEDFTEETEAREPVRAAATPALEPFAKVSLGDPATRRVAFIMAALTMVAFFVIALIAAATRLSALANILCLACGLGAGWFAVGLYQRSTGRSVTIQGGARLGWITGLATFLFMAAILGGGMYLAGDDVMKEIARQNPQVSMPSGDLASSIAFGLFAFLGLNAAACAAGGALGAKFAARGGFHNS